MKKVLLSLFAFIVCSYTLVRAQNVNQYITVYGHDFHSGYTDGVFSETRKIEIKNNSSYTLNIGTVYAYNYSTRDMFFIINYNGNADLPPYSSMYVTIENNSENNKYFSNTWVISVNYMNYNDYGNYSKEVKTKKGSISGGSSGELFEDLYPIVTPEPPILEIEPNDTFVDAELLNDSVVCTLSTIEDRDCFKVYANEGEELTFKVNLLSGNGLDGDRIFKYQICPSDLFPYWQGSIAFNSVETEKEVTITAFSSGQHYLTIYFDAQYPDYFYSDGAYSVKAYLNGQLVSVEKVDKNIMAIYAQNGNIHVKDANGKAVLVYSIDGKLVYNKVSDTDDVSIGLTSGIYIVKVGKITKKIKL